MLHNFDIFASRGHRSPAKASLVVYVNDSFSFCLQISEIGFPADIGDRGGPTHTSRPSAGDFSAGQHKRYVAARASPHFVAATTWTTLESCQGRTHAFLFMGSRCMFVCPVIANSITAYTRKRFLTRSWVSAT
jgi:hypothetical protein